MLDLAIYSFPALEGWTSSSRSPHPMARKDDLVGLYACLERVSKHLDILGKHWCGIFFGAGNC
jgi:hypothetical protein